MKEYAKKGAILTSRDFDTNPKLPSSSIYKRRFGNWGNALKAAGLPSNKKPQKSPFSNEELLEKLRKKADLIEATPSKAIVQKDKTMPNPNTYIYRFGSWNNALIAAGLKPIEKKIKKG